MELEQFYEFKLALGGIVFAVVAYGVLLSRKGVRLDFRELSLTPFPALSRPRKMAKSVMLAGVRQRTKQKTARAG